MKHRDAKALERLLQVQEIDLKIRSLENQIQEYCRRSKEEDPLLVQLKREQTEIDKSIETLEAQRQMYLGTLEDIRTAIKGLATTKTGAPKPRTRSSTEALRIEEEKLVALLAETEAQSKRLIEDRSSVIERIRTRSSDLEHVQQGPEAELRKVRTKMRKLEKDREEATAGLPPALLRKYDRLRSSRSGVGLTMLIDGICTVCRMQMPTAIIARLALGDHIEICPACGRMVAKVEFLGPLTHAPRTRFASDEEEDEEEEKPEADEGSDDREREEEGEEPAGEEPPPRPAREAQRKRQPAAPKPAKAVKPPARPVKPPAAKKGPSPAPQKAAPKKEKAKKAEPARAKKKKK